MSNIKKAAIEFYLDWVNNFGSPLSIAHHYGMTADQAKCLIDMGRQWYNEQLELQYINKIQ